MGWSTADSGKSKTREFEPAVCFSFDDHSESVYSLLRPVFMDEGVCGTFFMNPDQIGSDIPGMYGPKCTWAQVEQMADDSLKYGIGFEIQDHGYGHPYADPKSRLELNAFETAVTTGLALWKTHGIVPLYWAYPGHHINTRGKQIIQKHYLGARRASGPPCNLDSVDIYNTPGNWHTNDMALYKTESLFASAETKLEQVIEEKGFRCGCGHKGSPDGTNDGFFEPAKLRAIIQMTKAAGVRIIPFSQAINELRNRAFSWESEPLL